MWDVNQKKIVKVQVVCVQREPSIAQQMYMLHPGVVVDRIYLFLDGTSSALHLRETLTLESNGSLLTIHKSVIRY
jgi:hypothetical protein